MPQITVTIACKKGDNRAFKATSGTWYNVNDVVIPYLEKVNKGDVVTITTEKKGVAQYVTKLVSASAAPEQGPVTAPAGGEFTCNVCGKVLKDGKFKTCYMCNKKGLKPATKAEPTQTKVYDKGISDDRQAAIQRGNALNAAADIAAAYQFVNAENGEPDYEMAAQYTKLLAESLLEWLRAE